MARTYGAKTPRRSNDAAADIATADIVVATMLFLDDHIRAVLPALAARRDHCDAMVCCLCAGEVVRLTRIGKFSMAGEASGAMAWLKRLRGKRDGAGSSGQGQMKMLRRLPQLLRFIPGTAQDVRSYFLCLQYWLAGSTDNIVNVVRLLVGRYADGPRRSLRGCVKAKPPIPYPDVGLYHPADRAAHYGAPRPFACGRSRASRNRRRAGDAHVSVGRQRRPLRRRDRRAGGTRPEGDPGVRERARRAAGDREVLSPGRARHHRRVGLAHRVLARRRPGLQRCQSGGGGAGDARRAVCRRECRWSFRRWRIGKPPIAD